MPDQQPFSVNEQKEDWEGLQRTLNYLFKDIYGLLDTIQGRANKTFMPESIILPDAPEATYGIHTHESDAQGGKIDHGNALDGLSDDDHTQYFLVDGTRPMTGNLSFDADNIGITFGADAPNALLYYNGTQLFLDVTEDDESPGTFRIDNYTSFGNRVTMDDNNAWQWDDGAASWSAKIQSEAATGLYISARNRDMIFRTGVNGTTNRLIIEGDGDLIWNPGYNDDDFTIRKNTAGIAYMYDAGDDDHCFGDGGSTNYVKIIGNGDISFHGTAGFYPRFLTQAAEPAAGVGATQCDTSEIVVWKDSDDNKVYLCFNDGGTVKTVELA